MTSYELWIKKHIAKNPAVYPPRQVFYFVICSLLRDPQHHAGLFSEFFCKILYPSILHAGCHAMLDACRIETFFGEVRTQDAGFRRERKVCQVQAAIRKFLLHLKYFDASGPDLMLVFLGTGKLATVAPGAVFIVN
jgi:hypothetical protein